MTQLFNFAITDSIIQIFPKSLLNNRYNIFQRFWIGLSDPKGDENWQWISDSSSPNYTNWLSDEPNGHGTEKCVEMYAGRLASFWNDISCSFSAQYICEKDEGTYTFYIDILICPIST